MDSLEVLLSDMSVFRLTEIIAFPPSHYADPDGLLAVGGDLSIERLLLAYRMGIFPWYSERSPILWWSPDPRLVLFPGELRISKSLQRVVRKETFRITFDRAFRKVMERCASTRREQGDGTWIMPEMIEAYCHLHILGYAHSVETWYEGELVGGLYGIGLGRVFFGESMFSQMTDASKVALVYLVRLLENMNFELIDCQVTTEHLKRMGAREVPRKEFLVRLAEAMRGFAGPRSW